MVDQSLVQSGFDAEILLGEKQLTAVLLALVEAGRIPATVELGTPPRVLSLLGPASVDRTYTPHPDAHGLPTVPDSLHPFQVEILFEHTTGADVRVHAVIQFEGLPIEGDLFVGLALETERDEVGTLARVSLKVSVLDVESGILPFLESEFGLDKSEILAAIKEQADRTVDLGGVSAFKRVQDVAIHKLAADGDRLSALGLYVNLRLRTGPEPESLKEARGSLAAARNFLPAGSDVAMASRAGLYGDLASDGFHRFAEIDENGNVSHPWRKSPFNPKSERIGKIIGVRVFPLPAPNSTTLKIDVEVEYQIDDFFDPNGHLVLLLTPSTQSDGTLKWTVDADFHGSVALEIIGFIALAALFTGAGALLGLGLGAAVAGGFIIGTLADGFGHLIVDALRSGRVERKVDAGIPDVISGRVKVAQRRWDPFYLTHHDIATRSDGTLINEHGIALWGRAVLDKQIEPVEYAVIRDKRMQSSRPPTHLRYRIDDADSFRDDFEQLSPGTDRRPFAQHDRTNEPTLFELSIEQIDERLAEGRIVNNPAYVAKRIDMRQNQVHSILAASEREHDEVLDSVIFAFDAATRERITADESEQIRIDVEAEFAALGITPTPEGIDARVQEIIEERVGLLVEEFLNGPMDLRVEQALRPLLRFDLPPENLAALEKKKILHLVGLQIITMRAPGHEGFMYYRDKPDFFKPDNLHSLPRYRRTPDGPQFP